MKRCHWYREVFLLLVSPERSYRVLHPRALPSPSQNPRDKNISCILNRSRNIRSPVCIINDFGVTVMD